MKKIFCIICCRYRKFGKSEISYLLEKTLLLSIICSKCKNEDKKLFKDEKSIKTLKIFGLLEKIYYFKNMDEEIDEKKKLMSKRYKKVFTTLNYTEHFLVLDSTINECISISGFIFLLVFL